MILHTHAITLMLFVSDSPVTLQHIIAHHHHSCPSDCFYSIHQRQNVAVFISVALLCSCKVHFGDPVSISNNDFAQAYVADSTSAYGHKKVKGQIPSQLSI